MFPASLNTLMLKSRFFTDPGPDGFIEIVSSGDGVLRYEGLTIDNSDNIYAVTGSDAFGASSNDMLISKFDSVGAHLWSRKLNGPGILFESYVGVATDNSNNVYAVGWSANYGAGATTAIISKFNSTGTHLWSRTVDGGLNDSFNDVVIDNSGNAYAVGESTSFHTPGTGRNGIISKFNSSGIHQFTIAYDRSGQSTFRTVDITGSNLWIGGHDVSPAVSLVVKFNTSGSHLLSRFLPDTRTIADLTISSGNIFISGDTLVPIFNIISKYNSAMTHLFSRTVDLPAASSGTFNGVSIDGSGNIYGGGFFGNKGVALSKFNSAGTHQYTKRIQTGSARNTKGIEVNSSNNICMAGWFSGTPGKSMVSVLDPTAGLICADIVDLTGDVNIGTPSQTVNVFSPATSFSESPTVTSVTPAITSPVPTIVDLCRVP